MFRASHLELSASRPFPVYADGEHLTDLPASLRVLPRALSVLVPARPGLSAGRRTAAEPARCSAPRSACAGGRRRQPGQRPRRRHDAAGTGAAAAGAGGDRPARRRPRRRLDARQRHQRQDDDRRDDRRRARRRGPPAGPQPGRLEHDLGRRHGAARAARRARACSRSTRPGCRGSPSSCSPRLIVLGNLFRDQLDRYGEMEALADEWAKAVAARAGASRASPSTPTTR